MAKPIVAIVGRPNVGKSTLFNVLANERISIVEDIPGVTRDRLYATSEWLDREFVIIEGLTSKVRSEARMGQDDRQYNLKMTEDHMKYVYTFHSCLRGISEVKV